MALVVLTVGLMLGMGALLALGGFSSCASPQSVKVFRTVPTAPAGSLVESVTLELSPTATDLPIVIPTPSAVAGGVAASIPATPTATLSPVEVGSPRGEDSESVLLLYDSAHKDGFDTNFARVAEYYGLLCRKVALGSALLTDAVLRDVQGHYFKLIGISAESFSGDRPLLTDDQIEALASAVQQGGGTYWSVRSATGRAMQLLPG